MHILLSEFNSFLTVLLLEKMLKYENKSISLWSPLPYILLQLIDLQELKSRGETEILITLGAIRVFKFLLPTSVFPFLSMLIERLSAKGKRDILAKNVKKKEIAQFLCTEH